MTALWLHGGKLYVGAKIRPVVRADDPPRLLVKVFQHDLLVAPPDPVHDRIDVVCLRGAVVMIRYGQPAPDPQPPGLPDELVDAEVVAHIRVLAASTAITNDDITLVDTPIPDSEGS